MDVRKLAVSLGWQSPGDAAPDGLDEPFSSREGDLDSGGRSGDFKEVAQNSEMPTRSGNPWFPAPGLCFRVDRAPGVCLSLRRRGLGPNPAELWWLAPDGTTTVRAGDETVRAAHACAAQRTRGKAGGTSCESGTLR